MIKTDIHELINAILNKIPIQFYGKGKWLDVTQEEAEDYSIAELKDNYFRIAPSTIDVAIKDMPIPFKAKLDEGEKYYTFSFPACSVDSHVWDNDPFDFRCLEMGVCYRSNTDAMQAANRLKAALSI